MNFFDKIKRIFNIGGIELEFKVDHSIPEKNGEVVGKLMVVSHGERNVKKIHLLLKQRHDKNNNGTHTVEYISIGNIDYEVNYILKAGESKTLDFAVPFNTKKSLTGKVTDTLANQGGLLGVVGAIGSFVENIQTTYHLEAKAEVEGTLLSPDASTQVKLL